MAETIPTKAISSKTVATNFNKKKATCKIKAFYILLTFLLISISPLISCSVYYWFI